MEPPLGTLVRAHVARLRATCAAIKAPSLGRIGLAAAVSGGFALGFALGGQAQAVDAPRPAAVVSPAAAEPDNHDDDLYSLARPVESPMRGVDAYGSGAFGAPRDGGRRAHAGVDLVTLPGEPVRAPIAGVVTRIGAAYGGQDALRYVEIANPATRYTARVLYIGPTVRPGWAVAAGDVIGRAQSLAERYPAGMTNHVHVELIGEKGGRLNPLAVLPADATDQRPAA